MFFNFGVHQSIYLARVYELVTIVFALVRANEKFELVLLQELVRDIWPEIGAGTTQSIWLTTLVVLWITP